MMTKCILNILIKIDNSIGDGHIDGSNDNNTADANETSLKTPNGKLVMNGGRKNSQVFHGRIMTRIFSDVRSHLIKSFLQPKEGRNKSDRTKFIVLFRDHVICSFCHSIVLN